MLLDTFAEINQILLKIYVIHALLTFMFPSNTLSENWRCLLRDFYFMTLRGPLRELSFGYACWPAIQAGLPPQIKQTNKKGHWTRSRQNTSLCTASAHVYRTTGHILLEILDTAFKNFCQQEFTWWTRIQILVSLESIEPEVRYVLKKYVFTVTCIFH